MEKLEVVYELQKTIEQLYHETNLFEIYIKEILAFITAKRLMPDKVLERAYGQLETIRDLGKGCRDGYKKLEMAGEIPEYIEQIRMALTVTERLLKEREEYFLAKEEFLQLSSKYKEVEEPLLLCQKELAGYRIEAMTEEEVVCRLEKYVLFMKAWREKEAVLLIDYTQKLFGFFSKELVAAAVFQKDKLVLKKQAWLQQKKGVFEKNDQKPVIQEGVSQELEQKQFEDKRKNKVETLESLSEGLSGNQSEEKVERKAENQLEQESTFLKKYTYVVKVESCVKKEKKKFGVKSFRSDLSGVTEGLRKRIFRGIRQYGGVTVELLSAITRRTQKEIKQECETLFYNGYLRLYQVEGMGECYSVSPKGKKAFEMWEALAFLHIKGNLPKWQSLEETEDIGSTTATKLMFCKALASEYQKRAFPDIQVEYQIEQKVFFLKCRELDQTNWRYYTGASEWIEDETTYAQWLQAFIEKEEKTAIKWMVLGNSTCGERLKELILKTCKETMNATSILIRSYEEELVLEWEKVPKQAEKEAAVTEESKETTSMEVNIRKTRRKGKRE